MCNAFKATTHELTGAPTTPLIELKAALKYACHDASVDAILFGGDLISFPSPKGLRWALDALAQECQFTAANVLFTNGNHDWLLEGRAAADAAGRPYDWQREG